MNTKAMTPRQRSAGRMGAKSGLMPMWQEWVLVCDPWLPCVPIGHQVFNTWCARPWRQSQRQDGVACLPLTFGKGPGRCSPTPLGATPRPILAPKLASSCTHASRSCSSKPCSRHGYGGSLPLARDRRAVGPRKSRRGHACGMCTESS